MDVKDQIWAEAMQLKDKHKGAGSLVQPDEYLEEKGSWGTAA